MLVSPAEISAGHFVGVGQRTAFGDRKIFYIPLHIYESHMIILLRKIIIFLLDSHFNIFKYRLIKRTILSLLIAYSLYVLFCVIKFIFKYKYIKTNQI